MASQQKKNQNFLSISMEVLIDLHREFVKNLNSQCSKLDKTLIFSQVPSQLMTQSDFRRNYEILVKQQAFTLQIDLNHHLLAEITQEFGLPEKPTFNK